MSTPRSPPTCTYSTIGHVKRHAQARLYPQAANVIVFDRVDGPSIQDYILTYDRYPGLAERIDLDTFRHRLTILLEALAKAGWYHNDVSNRNIMIDIPTGEPRLIDFGASSPHGGDLERDLGHLADCLSWLRKSLHAPEPTLHALTDCLQD